MNRKYRIACIVGLFMGLLIAFCVPQGFFLPHNLDEIWWVPHISDIDLAKKPAVIALEGIAILLVGVKNILDNGLWLFILPPAILCILIKMEEFADSNALAWAFTRSIYAITLGDFSLSALWALGCCTTDTDVIKYWPYELWYAVQSTVFLIWFSIFSWIAPVAWVVAFLSLFIGRLIVMWKLSSSASANPQTILE